MCTVSGVTAGNQLRGPCLFYTGSCEHGHWLPLTSSRGQTDTERGESLASLKTGLLGARYETLGSKHSAFLWTAQLIAFIGVSQTFVHCSHVSEAQCVHRHVLILQLFPIL